MNAILIYEKPDAYFFPQLGNVYAPFAGPTGTPRYYAYRALNLLGIPACSFYWGGWREAVRSAELAVLFDYGYQRGMEHYIRRVNPNCRVVLFLWNKVDRAHSGYRHFTDPDAIYSTDPGDCERYGFRRQTTFYARQLGRDPGEVPGSAEEGRKRILFLGADKGRAERLRDLEAAFTQCGLDCDFRIVRSAADALAYPEYLALLDGFDLLLDLAQEGQTGPTLRVMEALFRSKRLITTNRTLQGADFYEESNILILPEGSALEGAVREFLGRPYRPVPAKIRDRYSYEEWVKRFR